MIWFKLVFLTLFAIIWKLEPILADPFDPIVINNILDELNDRFGIIFKNNRNFKDNSIQMYQEEGEREFRKYAYESLHKFKNWQKLADERTMRYFSIYNVYGTFLLPDGDYRRLKEIFDTAATYSRESYNWFKGYLDSELLSKMAVQGKQIDKRNVKEIDKKIQEVWLTCSAELAPKIQPLIEEFGDLITRNCNPPIIPKQNTYFYWGQMLGYGYYFLGIEIKDLWAASAGESTLTFIKNEVIRTLKLRNRYINRPIPAYVYSILRHRELYRNVFPAHDFNDILHRATYVKIENVFQITELAEYFFTSLNFPELGERFWLNSELNTRSAGLESGVSSVFIDNDNYRLIVNSAVSLKTYESIYRELFRLYRNIIMNKNNLEWTFRVSDFQPFDDALEDAIIMATKTVTYTLKSKILVDTDYTDEQVFSALMAEASSVYTELSSSIALETWSYSTLFKNMNISQWHDRHKYEIVLAILDSSKNIDYYPYVDCSSPEHVFPFQLNYLHSARTILKYQIFGGLCAMAGQYSHLHPEEKLLHKCDISENTEVGNFLQHTILSSGSGLTWRQKLKLITGNAQLTTLSIVDYFKPIFIHMRILRRENVTLKEKIRKFF